MMMVIALTMNQAFVSKMMTITVNVDPYDSNSSNGGSDNDDDDYARIKNTRRMSMECCCVRYCLPLPPPLPHLSLAV